MMKKILFVSLLLMCALAGVSHGQSNKLIFFNPSTNGTVFLLGETLTVSVNVMYIGSGTNEGASYPINTLAFNYTVNGTAGEPLPVQSSSLVLLHQKTATLTFHIPVSSNLFQEGGGHVIIIWPITTVPADAIPGSIQLPEIHVQLPPSQIKTPPDANPYPNPTTGIVNVEVPDTRAELFLYNQRGQCVVKSLSGSSSRSLDLGLLPPGTYTLIIRSGGKITRKTIFKQ